MPDLFSSAAKEWKAAAQLRHLTSPERKKTVVRNTTVVIKVMAVHYRSGFAIQGSLLGPIDHILVAGEQLSKQGFGSRREGAHWDGDSCDASCYLLFQSTMSSISFSDFGPSVLRPPNTSLFNRANSRWTTSGCSSHRFCCSPGSAVRS
jgi:hypothetical protein